MAKSRLPKLPPPDEDTLSDFLVSVGSVRTDCGSPLSVEDAMKIHEEYHYPCDEIEGVVYRVERHGKVDFLAKYVRPDKVDGKYLESVTGQPNVWNWRP